MRRNTHFVAAQSGETARSADEAHREAHGIFENAESVIANNEHGGAGYFAEAHHTASLNIDAAAAGTSVRAERLGSTEFGSADILLDDGAAYNPKFYATAKQSYDAGAELVGSGEEMSAKYAGQTIIVPADQIDSVRQYHREAIDLAIADGDVVRREALKAVTFSDRIVHQGVSSQPLTYDEAQAGAETIRKGELPAYAGEDATLFEAGAEGALFASTIALATTVAPQLFRDVVRVAKGELGSEVAIERLKLSFSDAQTRSSLSWSAARGGGAAAATMLDALDPIGAAFTVNLLVDAVQLAQRVGEGDLKARDFGGELLERAMDRGVYTGLTVGAVWAVGPVGLLAPILIRRIVASDELQRHTLHGWSEVSANMGALIRSRLESVTLFDEVGQHHRSANAHSRATVRSASDISNDLGEAIRLLGFERAPTNRQYGGRSA